MPATYYGAAQRRAAAWGWPGAFRASLSLLDLVIGIYAAALAALMLTGGFSLGPLSLNEPAKPLLVLVLLVPVRLTLPRRSSLGARIRPWLETLWSGVSRPLGRTREALADVLFVLVVTRGATFAIAFMANLLLSPSRPRSVTLPFERSKFIEIFVAWDSGWYFDIARRGYYFDAGAQSSVAFFPLYPMTVRAVAWPWGGNERALWIASVMVSCVAFAAALVVLHRFAESVLGSREAARRTVLYLALFPFAVFMTRVYAEPLLLLMSVLAVRAAWHGHYAAAGLWGALATLARPNGVLIGLPLVLLALRDRPRAIDVIRRALWLAPVPLALAGYCGFVYGLSGDPLAWLSSQRHWGYSLGHAPWQQLLKLMERLVVYGPYDYFLLSNLAPYRLLHGTVALAFLALTPAVFRYLGTALGAYVLASLLVPLSGNALEGVGRYASVLFPVFMLLGHIGQSRRVHEFLLIASALFLAFFVVLFVTLHPIY